MAIAFDKFTDLGNGTGNISATHTPVGTPRGVIVHVTSTGASDEVSGVTYGGTAMTEVTGSPVVLGGGEDGNVSSWFLGASIPTGAQTVTVTVSGATNKAAYCITYTASDDTEVVDTSSTSSTSAANPSFTVSLGGRSCAVSEIWYSGMGDPTNVTPLTGWTSRAEFDFGSDIGGIYTYDTIGTSDVTAGYTSGADDVVILATAIAEVVGGGGGSVFTPYFYRQHIARMA